MSDAPAPAGWSLSGTKGAWVGNDVLSVTGDGEDNGYWSTTVDGLEPGRVYKFSFRARAVEGAQGTVIAGPDFANRDYGNLGTEWTELTQVFRVPEGVTRALFRLGHWKVKGTIEFDLARISPAVAIRPITPAGMLGERESIVEGRYRFSYPGTPQVGNAHRNVWRATAGFNTYRWTFAPGREVIYRLGVPGHPFASGRVVVGVTYHRAGTCLVDVAPDAQQWQTIGQIDKEGSVECQLPDDMLPAETLFVRLRPADGPATFQIGNATFEAELSAAARRESAGEIADAAGWTQFARVTDSSDKLHVDRAAVDSDPADGRYVLRAVVTNLGDEPARAALAGRFEARADDDPSEPGTTTPIAPGASVELALPFPDRWAGGALEELAVLVDGAPVWRAEGSVDLPDYFRADYGALITGIEAPTSPGEQAPTSPGEQAPTSVWWARAGHKIPPTRALPSETSPAAEMSAARNDLEAVQVVVRPRTALKGLTATASALAGPDGATIAADAIDICRVYYHHVTHPTDGTGLVGPWPDALPPLDEPLDVEPGTNQPLWIRVHVPADAKPGDYTGTIELSAEGFSATVPLRLHVWNFALPKTNRIATAFGLKTHNINRYHQLKSDADKRRVLDMYFELMSENRISPYDPTPYDPWLVKFISNTDQPRAEVDFSAFDSAMERAIERFNFTHFRMRLEGIGWGSYSGRGVGRIDGHEAGTPEYEAMFASQANQIEEHLASKGWLDMAYLYWFDEPHPHDYPFVREVMQRVHRAAPGIPRFLTEQPEPPLYDVVDIWCPVSYNYDHAVAEQLRGQGDEFWWYVCCGPKAPYATLFIDHPATEMRVWLWQTWKRDITGVLVWSINYWTSPAEYRDQPQNPYKDPMGYRSRYATPGVPQYWGNGDGRFLYPPLAAAEPGISGPEPVIEPPVSCIRLEMLREGIEDYEMLWMLRDLLAERGDARGRAAADALPAAEREQFRRLLDVPASISESMTQFTTDPEPILEHRRQVAEAIETLSVGER